MANGTEEVRTGTLKLLSERITEQRKEIDKLNFIVRKLRFKVARSNNDPSTGKRQASVSA